MGLLESMLAESGVTPPTASPMGSGDGLMIPPPQSGPNLASMAPSMGAPEEPIQAPPAMNKSLQLKEAISDFAGNFLFSLGQAMKASASAPGRRGTMAGMGAALEAPMVLQQQRQQHQMQLAQQAMEQQRIDIERQKAQSDIGQNSAMTEVAKLNAAIAQAEALRKAKAPIEVSPGATLVDQITKQPIMTAPRPEKPPDMTPEEKFIDLAIQAEQSKTPGGKLSTAQEIQVRQKAKKDWSTAAQDPQMQELLMQGRQLQNQLAQDALNKRQSNELNANDNRRVDKVVSEFNSNGVVKDFIERQNKYESMKATIARGWSGPGDLALVYQFMKALDPTSVVRESEYAAAAKSGNIFSGWAARFNGQMRPEGGFLSDQVKKDFLGLAKLQLDTTAKQYGQVRQDYASRINRIAKQNVGEDWLPNYAGAFESPTSTGGGSLKDVSTEDLLKQLTGTATPKKTK